MPISDSVFMSILAMDSYNRGYNPGLVLEGSAIGAATLKPVGLPSGSQDAGFFAQAYDWNGKTVISYRGTDQLLDSNGNVGDVFTGWVTGGGAYGSPQAQLAALFYQSVNGGNAGGNSNMILTGHSLGGGLAGLVGKIYGVNGARRCRRRHCRRWRLCQ